MSKEHPPNVDPALVAGLATRAGDLANIAEDLIETVRRDRVIKLLGGIISLVLLGGMGLNLWNTFATKDNTKIIKSCTDPKGQCYQDSRRSTGQSVKSINDISIAAAYCAQLPENNTLEKIRICVAKALTHN